MLPRRKQTVKLSLLKSNARSKNKSARNNSTRWKENASLSKKNRRGWRKNRLLRWLRLKPSASRRKLNAKDKQKSNKLSSKKWSVSRPK